MTKLIIVESPGKIKKIRKILGPDWNVKASMGHFRTLAKDGEDNLGFDVVGDLIKMRFEAKDFESKKVIKKLREAAKKATQVFVATDPDREGEVIAWHIYQILKHKNKVRIAFSEITEKALKQAIANPRELDLNLVGSGLARSCLDRLIGFRGSAVIRALGGTSVGRVQSAVLRLLCERERLIKAFKPEDYFSVYVEYAQGFKSFYSHGGLSKKTSTQESESEKPQTESARIHKREEAEYLVEIAKNSPHKIVQIDRKTTSKNPPPPFETSTLQQESGSKLGLSPDKTMKIAQTLYEKGLITYMRTDSVVLSEEFCDAAKSWLESKDPNNIPDKKRKHQKSKNSQEGHEAIRPSNLNLPSAKLKEEISQSEFDLYLMIWMRAIASQCKAALIDKTAVTSKSGETYWKAEGKMLKFKGYARYWNNLSADSQLPELEEEQPLQLDKAKIEAKRTSPPSRYDESQLVGLIKKKGIGRPSTYDKVAPIIKKRNYAKISTKKLVPTDLGMTVDNFMGEHFSDLVDAKFTAGMESSLDAIANGEEKWQPYIINWNQTYFDPALAQARLVLPESERKPKGTVTPSDYKCPVCGENLEQYDYIRDGETKSLLRCSDRKSWKKSDHKNVAFWRGYDGNWRSKKFGEPGKTKPPEKAKNKTKSTRKSSPIKLKTSRK